VTETSSGTTFDLVIREVRRETAAAASFVLDIAPQDAARFHYLPGQYLTVVLPWQNFEVQRCYSLSSAPLGQEAPTITVKRVNGGRVSNWLIDNLAKGNVLRCIPPLGDFVRPAECSSPVLAFAGGSGITPAISIIKQALIDTTVAVTLVYANRDAAEVIFADELAQLVRTHPDRFVVHHHLDAESGYITVDAVVDVVAKQRDARVFLCGPAPFMGVVENGVLAGGISPDMLHIERFASPIDADRLQAERIAAAANGGAPNSIAVTFRGQRHHLDYVEGQTVLETCKAAGVDVPRSCEDGFCGTCMAVLKYGEPNLGNAQALSASDVTRGRVLTCQLRPASSLPFGVTYDEADFRIRETDGQGTDVPSISAAKVGWVVALLTVGAIAVRLLRDTLV
jgi:3-ketosteroid 9alpha-monooxygenase subunit B